MPQQYEVTQIVKDETWPGRDDEMRTVEMALKGVGTAVKVTAATKFKSPYNADKWPEAGDTIFGDVESGKFRFAQRNGSGPQSGSQAAGGDKQPPECWEAKDRRIQRQHSQEMALRFADATGDLEELHIGDEKTVPEVLKSVRRLADWFDADVQRVSDEVLDKAAESEPAPADKPDGDLPF